MCNLLKTIGLCFFSMAFLANPVLFASEQTDMDEKAFHEQQLKVAQEPGAVTFIPPEGWHLANSKDLPPRIKIMVVGKGSHEFPPSINLAAESFPGTLKDYLKIVREINETQGTEWKDLGTIKTDAGNASLSQVDMKTQWGTVRMMHVILIKNNNAYILTTSALKDEFPVYYKDFFASMRSLRINKSSNEIAAAHSSSEGIKDK